MPTETGGSPSELEWVEGFRARHGRAPRVLHVGNIANNAYLNAKILRARGVESDVCAYAYYHIMGCPEWEDAPVPESDGYDFHPWWNPDELGGFERPRWFVQGPESLCRGYLRARAGGRAIAGPLWRLLEWTRHARAWAVRDPWVRFAAEILGDEPDGAPRPKEPPAFDLVRRVMGTRWPFGATLRYGLRLAIEVPVVLVSAAASLVAAPTVIGRASRWAGWNSASDDPDAEILARSAGWAPTLAHYDAVVGYATDGSVALAAGKRPYLAFEHGTIRHLPFEDSADGRLCARVYREADEVLVTNCDNREAAERLGLERYRFAPHPINEVDLRDDPEGLRRQWLERLDADFLVFHPARQHWEERRHPDWEKGNDIFFRGFAAFVRDHAPRAAAICVAWGAKLEESRALIEELGIADRVHWIRPLPNLKMLELVRAVDLVADQFYLGAFGSTMPKALQQGIPAMLRLDEAMHAWCFDELPPLLNVAKPDEVRDGLVRLYADASFREALGREGRAWYERWHSADAVAHSLGGAIGDALGRTGALG